MKTPGRISISDILDGNKNSPLPLDGAIGNAFPTDAADNDVSAVSVDDLLATKEMAENYERETGKKPPTYLEFLQHEHDQIEKIVNGMNDIAEVVIDQELGTPEARAYFAQGLAHAGVLFIQVVQELEQVKRNGSPYDSIGL